MQEWKHRTWAEVNLEVLRQNYTSMRDIIPIDCKFMAVIKADAYGHGAVSIAKALQTFGVDYLSVASLDEAMELREAGITLPILILGYTDPEEVGILIKNDITQTVFGFEMAKEMSSRALELGQALRVHIKVDTGMSRLGFVCADDNINHVSHQIKHSCFMEGLDVEGIFTHCASADEDDAYTNKQINRFTELLSILKQDGCQFSLIHMANSAGILYDSSTHFNMVRAGIAMYGYYPNEEYQYPCKISPILELKSRIISIKRLTKGTSIGYGNMHILEYDTDVAVIAIGYADGLSRLLSDCFTVSIEDKNCPILGRICMDMCMVDLCGVSASVGDEVYIYKREIESRQTIVEAARIMGTVPYELLCSVSKRVPRRYL